MLRSLGIATPLLNFLQESSIKLEEILDQEDHSRSSQRHPHNYSTSASASRPYISPQTFLHNAAEAAGARALAQLQQQREQWKPYEHHVGKWHW